VRTHEDGGRVNASNQAGAAADGGREDFCGHDLQQQAGRIVRPARLQDSIDVAEALRAKRAKIGSILRSLLRCCGGMLWAPGALVRGAKICATLCMPLITNPPPKGG
jgi:hypothetical protein